MALSFSFACLNLALYALSTMQIPQILLSIPENILAKMQKAVRTVWHRYSTVVARHTSRVPVLTWQSPSALVLVCLVGDGTKPAPALIIAPVK